MAHYLNAENILSVCKDLDLSNHYDALIAAMDAAAEEIAKKLNIEVTAPTSAEDGFGGLLVGFGPKDDKQPCPTEIIDYDEESDWAEETSEVAAT